MSLSELWELVMDKEAWRAAIHGVEKSQTRLRNWTEVKVKSDFCDPMDCSLPGSSLHGILQARVLEGVAISFSKTELNWTENIHMLRFIIKVQ